jgi:hypothetical protein
VVYFSAHVTVGRLLLGHWANSPDTTSKFYTAVTLTVNFGHIKYLAWFARLWSLVRVFHTPGYITLQFPAASGKRCRFCIASMLLMLYCSILLHCVDLAFYHPFCANSAILKRIRGNSFERLNFKFNWCSPQRTPKRPSSELHGATR